MPFPEHLSFTRYLHAKKRLDDRALNKRLWERLLAIVPPSGPKKPLHVLEVGGGLGTMATRLFESKFAENAIYTLVDSEPDTAKKVQMHLAAWADGAGVDFGALSGPEYELRRQEQVLRVRPVAEDLYTFSQRTDYPGAWDLVLGHALLDLLDLPVAVPALFRSLKSGGIFYFTLNFDGLTGLEPAVDPELDQCILEAYHQSMDDRFIDGLRSGDRHTGQKLFHVLEKAGGKVLDVGSSDWIVWPENQAYPGDEAYFLQFIVETIKATLEGSDLINRQDLDRWTSARHAQIDRGELFFIAHQIDYLGRV